MSFYHIWNPDFALLQRAYFSWIDIWYLWEYINMCIFDMKHILRGKISREGILQ